MEFPPQNMRIQRVSSDDADTIAARDLVQALQNQTPNISFATINETHQTALRNFVELFNMITKVAEKQ